MTPDLQEIIYDEARIRGMHPSLARDVAKASVIRHGELAASTKGRRPLIDLEEMVRRASENAAASPSAPEARVEGVEPRMESVRAPQSVIDAGQQVMREQRASPEGRQHFLDRVATAPEPPAEQTGEVDPWYVWPNEPTSDRVKWFKGEREYIITFHGNELVVNVPNGGNPFIVCRDDPVWEGGWQGNWRRVTPSAAGEVEQIEGKTPWEFACAWYKPAEIARGIAGTRYRFGQTPTGIAKVPTDVFSGEFADWMTEQYRLAMSKGIDLGLRNAVTQLDATNAERVAERSRREAADDKNDRQAATITRDMKWIADLEAQLATLTVSREEMQGWMHEQVNEHEHATDAREQGRASAFRDALEMDKFSLFALARPAPEAKPERPPMILARPVGDQFPHEWLVWSPISEKDKYPWMAKGCNRYFGSPFLHDIDRDASDQRAVEIYDADLAAAEQERAK